MPRLLLASALVMAVGATLVLSELRWFSREPLVDRLRPYGPGAWRADGGSGVLSVASFRDVIGPLARRVGDRLAALLGVSESLELRLARVRSPMTVTDFRVHQLGRAALGFAVGALLAAVLRPPSAIVLLFLLGGSALGYLL